MSAAHNSSAYYNPQKPFLWSERSNDDDSSYAAS